MENVEVAEATRTERALARGRRRRRIAAYAAVLVAVLGVGSAGLWLAGRGLFDRFSGVAHGRPATLGVASVASSSSTPSVVAASQVEVPDLVGMSVDQAATLLQAAGLGLRLSVEGSAAAATPQVVTAQQPTAGTLLNTTGTVVLVVPPKPAKASQLKAARKSVHRYVVVIDPGHQAHADEGLEPIGPGSAEFKPRVNAGATGVSSGVPEYEIDLEIATNLQQRLEGAGVTVVMTRTTNDVDISNAERAQIASGAKARLFVRVHADSSADPSVCGVATFYPAFNQWTKSIVSESTRAAQLIDLRLASCTGATDGGAQSRADIAGFNWATVPAVFVQTGYQSNPVEDRLLASARYQDQIAQGIADGVLTYLDSTP